MYEAIFSNPNKWLIEDLASGWRI